MLGNDLKTSFCATQPLLSEPIELSEGLEGMFPCKNLDEVERYFGDKIKQLVEKVIAERKDESLQDCLRLALRRHFAMQNEAANIGLNAELNSEPDPAVWVSHRPR